jgi:aminoglycoside phosphotransferase (APT) family kinase protein
VSDDIAWSAPLAEWLAARLGARTVTITEVGMPSSGFSAETMLFTAVTPDGDRRLVLRKETPDPPVYPSQVPGLTVEVEIQYRAMEAMAHASDIPLAPLVGYEGDTAVLGTQFFVMGAVAGDVPIENPPYTQAGFFVDATAEQRHRMIACGLDVLARVHAVDWRAAGFGWLLPHGEEPTAARQLRIWEEYAYRELDGRTHPGIDRARDWLHANLPYGSAPGVCWGDPRPGNIIWDDFTPACVTDWEAVSIAPPEVDIGWWLFFDRTMHETVGAPRRPGDPTREEQRALYAGAAGRDVGDLAPFEVLSGFRYAAIVVRVMNRLVARGDLPPDQTIWLDNPPAQALTQVLDEVGA